MDTDGDLKILLRRTGLLLGQAAAMLSMTQSGLSDRLARKRTWRVREVVDLHRLLARYRVRISEGALLRLCSPPRGDGGTRTTNPPAAASHRAQAGPTDQVPHTSADNDDAGDHAPGFGAGVSS